MINKRNRMAAKRPKLGFGICICDKASVGMGSKCHICKTRMGGRRLKKDANILPLTE